MKRILQTVFAALPLVWATAPALAQPGAFSLSLPEHEATITVEEGNDDEIVFTWQRPTGAQSYLLLVADENGEFANPSLRIPSEDLGRDTFFVVTSGMLDALAEAAGVEKGWSGTSRWTVRAYSQIFFQGDSTDAAPPHDITLVRRGTIDAFALVAPPSGFPAVGKKNHHAQADILTWSWGKTNSGTRFQLLIDVLGDWEEPMIAIDAGTNTSISLTAHQMDSVFSAAGLNVGDTVQAQWTVRGWNLTDSRLAEEPRSIALILDEAASTRENIFSSSIKMFPNPAQNTVVVELPNAQRTNLRILNAQGQVVAERVLTQQLNTVDVSGFNTGLYFFHLQQQGGMAVKPVQVAR